MENQMTDNREPKKSSRHYSGRVIGGIVVLMVGMAILARQAGLDLPYWLFSWPMILIVISLYVGGRENFRIGGWIAIFIAGMIFLADDVLDDLDLEIGRYFWPIIIIGLGLYMILKPRRGEWTGKVTSGDAIDSTAIFGGTKNNVISKNFKGGEISTMFGGTDINLTQADFEGTVVIQSSTAFGGVNILAPAHWNIQTEVVCIFGGIEDNRPQPAQGFDKTKTLVLKGTCIFGGVEVKSF